MAPSEKQEGDQGKPVDKSGWRMSRMKDPDRNVPKDVLWFERTWEQLGIGNITHWRNDRVNRDYILLALQSDGKRVISVLEVGPKGGIQELLYVYDSADLREARIKAGGPVSDRFTGCLLPMSAISFDKKKQGWDRPTTIGKAQEYMQELLAESQTAQGEVRIRSFIGEETDYQSQSVHSMSVGFPGMGERK